MNKINDVQKMAAEKEYRKVKAGGPAPQIIAFLLFSIGGCFGVSILKGTDKIICVIVCVCACILSIGELIKRKKRMDYLRKIIDSTERYMLCPFCKSADIESDMVHSGSSTTMSVTRISDNINPLHPFTHTNVRPGKTNTREYYGTIYQCRSCGKTFNEPEIIYK